MESKAFRWRGGRALLLIGFVALALLWLPGCGDESVENPGLDADMVLEDTAADGISDGSPSEDGVADDGIEADTPAPNCGTLRCSADEQCCNYECVSVEDDPEKDAAIRAIGDARKFATANKFTEFLPQLDGMEARCHQANGDNDKAKALFEQMKESTPWEEEKAYARRMLAAMRKDQNDE